MAAVLRRSLGLVAAAVAVLLLAGVGTLTWLVRHDGWLVQTVATGSMSPTVPTGSVLLTRPVDADEVAVGDIVVFESPSGSTVELGPDGEVLGYDSMLITHRVVRVEHGPDGGLMFRTKGDANEGEDPWATPADAVLTRYVGHVPHLGTLLSSPDLRRWLYLAIAGAGLVVVVGESRSIIRTLRGRAGTTAVRSERRLQPSPVTQRFEAARHSRV